LTKIWGTYIETGALGTFDNQIVRKWARVFSSTYDRVSTNAMKTLKITILLLSFWTFSLAQDGSDIRYFKIIGVDSTLVSQFVHLDFFNRSFRGQSIDTITITIDNRPTRFIEVRKDNGYNNWFSQQSLQSIDKIDGQTIKIPKFKLDRITTTSFQVTMYVEYYDNNNNLLVEKARQIEYWFDKKDIIEVLVKSKQR
jgi:hypothetical protein